MNVQEINVLTGEVVVRDYTPEEVALIAASQPPAMTNEQHIALILQPIGIAQAWQLDALMAGAIAYASLNNMTEAQLYEANAGYRTAKDLALKIAPYRS